MPRLLLIHAGPTPWDAGDRLVGSHSLPLTPAGEAAAHATAQTIGAGVEAIYYSEANEACRQVAELLAGRLDARLKDVPALEEWSLGLWEGLTRAELRHRFPTVFEQWEEKPLTVMPPEGETADEVIERLRPALRKIVRRHREGAAALVLRPLALQMAAGLLRGEAGEQIVRQLQATATSQTVELSDEDAERLSA